MYSKTNLSCPISTFILNMILFFLIYCNSASADISVSGVISEDTTWSDTSERYVLTGSVSIESGVTLTISPGVEIYTSSSSDRIYVIGTLNASGAILTSVSDLRVYGGGTINGGTFRNIKIYGDPVEISHCTLTGGTYGVYISDASPTISYNLIINNTYGIYVTGDSCPKINYNQIYANSSYGIYNEGTCHVFSPYNWWGDKSGPTHADNPDGTGDDIFGDVYYTRWIGSPSQIGISYGLNNSSPKSADPVNTATGNYIYESSDLFIKGIGININFVRSYNSQSGVNGQLGFGWSHNYNINISIDGDGIASIQYGDGHSQEFLPDGEGGFLSPPDTFDILEDNGDDTYTLTTRDNLIYLINEIDGKLATISDLNDNTISFIYDVSGDLVE